MAKEIVGRAYDLSELLSSEAAVGAALAEKLHASESLNVPHPERPEEYVPFITLPSGLTLHSLKEHLDEYRTRPERREGVAELRTEASFIDHANRFKDADSALFADPNPGAPSLTSVLNYHRQGATADPRFGDHRGVYRFPLSKEWKAWQALNEKPMTQEAFASFLEDRIVDVADPREAGAKANEFLKLLGGSFADAARLMDLSRGLTIYVAASATKVVNLASGEGQITYTEEHHNAGGVKLDIPRAFLIGLPVFHGGTAYQVAVRLRYRLKENHLTWSYSLHRTDVVFDHAFEEACKRAADATGLPLFVGSPE